MKIKLVYTDNEMHGEARQGLTEQNAVDVDANPSPLHPVPGQTLLLLHSLPSSVNNNVSHVMGQPRGWGQEGRHGNSGACNSTIPYYSPSPNKA